MKEFHIEGSPNGTVIMGEYMQADTEDEAVAKWKMTHSGWQLERVLEVPVGCNYLGIPRPR